MGRSVKHHSAFIATAFLVLLAAIAATSARPPEAQTNSTITKNVGEMTPEEEQQFSDTAEATIERVCLACHPFEMIAQARRTPADWNIQVDTMATRGAQGTAVDFALIKKYLTRYYGAVRINTATPEDLTAVLGLAPKVAAAVVAYRKAHGHFADLASIEQVTGVDKAKLEEQADAVRFD
jgi:competence ComEA-like helix-hairpin-helix protein